MAGHIRRYVSIAAAALLTACASPSPQPETMRDPTANFASYRTFGWAETPAVDGRDAPLRLLDGNIRAAIAAEMQKRGYTQSSEGPDLLLAYETASADRIESSPVRVGVGMGTWGGSVGGSVNVGTPSVRNYREGSLVIHVVERERNAEVWQGRISGRMTQGSLEAAAIQRGVTLAMRDFPAAQTATQ